MSITGSRRPILSVRHLKVDHAMPREALWRAPGRIRAVDDVHLDLFPGETLGVVGESGCGKSTLARSLIGLQPVSSGQILLDGDNVTQRSEAAWRPLRRKVQMVFQDPLASLDPRMTIGEIVEEPLRALAPELDATERERRVLKMLDQVGLPQRYRNRYPHEFSGGQCQRAGIARALILRPKVLICDEPVSALDVSIQAQIINLLADLQKETGLAMLFIAHDLAVVRHISHRVLVMYMGRVMEAASRDMLFSRPAHPYTRALLSAVPTADPARLAQRIILKGELPDPANPPSGCVFRTRCPLVAPECASRKPGLRRVTPESHSACHFASDPELAA